MCDVFPENLSGIYVINHINGVKIHGKEKKNKERLKSPDEDSQASEVKNGSDKDFAAHFDNLYHSWSELRINKKKQMGKGLIPLWL